MKAASSAEYEVGWFDHEGNIVSEAATSFDAARARAEAVADELAAKGSPTPHVYVYRGDEEVLTAVPASRSDLSVHWASSPGDAS